MIPDRSTATFQTGGIAEALATASESQELAKAQRENVALRRRLSDAETRAKVSDEARERMARELGLLTTASNAAKPPPNWLTATKQARQHRGTPWLLLSDLHLDEVVNPAEMQGVNAYDRRIAEMRLAHTFTSAVKITRDHWSGITYDGIVCPLAGDIFSGDIHDELTQTNADTMLGSVLHWSDHLAAGISLLADEFGKVHIPVVVGNHGRRSRKPRAKMRARDNFDWFLGHLLARMFHGDKRVTFQIGEATDAIVQSYGQRVCITHGDQTNGGGGIGGIWPPIMRMDARKRARAVAVQQPYDLMVCGHWHQLTFGPSFIVNGSLKGYDEYAMVSNFSFEAPQQALWLMTPEHGKTFTAPILPQDRKAEGW